MTVKTLIASLTQQEDLNFLLTNRIPRNALTHFMGRFSKIRQPLAFDVVGLTFTGNWVVNQYDTTSGAFRIEGRSGQGTRLTIELPLSARA